MKIIGKTEKGFILEANETEVYNMKGLYSKYSAGEHRFKIDDEINVVDVYRRYTSLEELIKSDRFEKSLQTLHQTIKDLTPIEELITQTKTILK